jgi:hypothetical protein
VALRSLTVAAKNLQSAQALHSALAGFDAELQQSEGNGYCVVVSLKGPERRIVDVLGALQKHVIDRNDGPARVDLDGRPYTMH